MKKYLRLYLFNIISLWLATNILAGVNLKEGWQTLVVVALVLTLINLVVKPLVNLLLLPLNLLTLGLFRWVSNVIALYLVTAIIPEFEISGFNFPGFSYQGFIIPQMYLTTFWVFVIASFIISLVTSFLLWLTK
ncbi:MAG: phage holin family protein [Microgenomates group bacterium]